MIYFIVRHLDKECAHFSFNQTWYLSCFCSMDSTFTLTITKKHLCWSVPISDRAGNQRCGLFEQCNHHRQDVDLLLRSLVQAIDKWTGSIGFFSPTKTVRHEIENEKHGYHILWSGKPGVHVHCARWSNNQCGLVHQSTEAAYYDAYPT